MYFVLSDDTELDATVSIGPSLSSITSYQTKVDIFNLEFIENYRSGMIL